MSALLFRRMLGIGSGFFAITVAWSVYNAYMPLLLGAFIESRGLRGAIMGLDNLMALLLIPLIGTWSDRVRSPLGSRLPFLLVAFPAAGLLLAALPHAATGLALLILVDLGFLFAMTVLRAPVIALMPDHVAPEQRSAANGIINLMGGLGGLTAFFALAPLWDVGRAWPFLLGGGLLMAALPLLLKVVERDPPYADQAEVEEGTPLTALLRGLRQVVRDGDPHLKRLLAALFLVTIAFASVEAQFTTYATERLGLTGGTAGILLGVFALAFVVTALPAGLAGSRFGKARTMRLGLGVFAAALVLTGTALGLPLLGAALVAAGAAWALVNVQAYPWVADLGGRTRIGFHTGLYYLVTMAAAVVGPALAGTAMDLFGDVALFVLAAAFAVAAGVVLPGREGAPAR